MAVTRARTKTVVCLPAPLLQGSPAVLDVPEAAAGQSDLAEQCREQLRLGEVWFVPASQPPHKGDGPRTPGRERAEMIEFAIAGHETFQLSRSELERSGPSFTVDTLTDLHAAHPDHEWWLLLGADSLRDFPTWREPERTRWMPVTATGKSSSHWKRARWTSIPRLETPRGSGVRTRYAIAARNPAPPAPRMATSPRTVSITGIMVHGASRCELT